MDHSEQPDVDHTQSRAGQPLVTSAGELLVVDEELHRVLAIIDHRVLLASVAAHRIFLEQDESGAIGLPTSARVNGLIAAGRAHRPTLQAKSCTDEERLVVELEMLDRAAVRNGTKAIAIFLHTAWTADLRTRFGEHDDPASLKRWRTVARRGERA